MTRDADRCVEPAVGELLAAYELGLLDPGDRERFELHLERCPGCADDLFAMAPYTEEIRSHAGAVQSLRSSARSADSVAPGQSSLRSSEEGRAPMQRPAMAIPRWRWGLAAGAAATATLLVLLLPRGGSVSELADPTPLPWVGIETRAPGAEGATASFQRGMELYSDGRYAAAAETLSAAIGASRGEDRLSPLAPVYLGVAWLQVGRLEEALAPLEEATNSDLPAVAERARWYLAQVHVKLDRPREAAAQLRRLEASPVYGEAARTQLDALGLSAAEDR